MRYIEEMLVILDGYVFIYRVVSRQFYRDSKHIQAELGHPARTVALFQVATGGQGLVAVKHPYIVHAQEASPEDVTSIGVFTVHPPTVIEHQAMEHLSKKCQVTFAIQLRVNAIHAQ